MQTLAITGANGFVGRHLVAYCLSRGDVRLRLLTRDRKTLKHMTDPRAIVCEGDLLNPESLEEFLQGDVTLIHLAYMHHRPDVNIEATSNVIDASRRARARRVVHCSTAVVVGPKAGGVITEQTPLSPKGEYQETKCRIEEMLRRGLLPSVELSILRPTEIIGPRGQGLCTMIDRLRRAGVPRRMMYRFLLRHRRFNYVSVDNVVAALTLLASSAAAQSGEAYIVSDDDDADNNYADVEAVIDEVLGRRCGPRCGIGIPRCLLAALFRLRRGSSPLGRIYSYEKIASIGYKKRTALRVAVAETVAWVQAECSRSCGRRP